MITVAANGLLAKGRGTLDATKLSLGSGATLQLKSSGWDSTYAYISNPLTVGANRTVLIGMSGGDGSMTFSSVIFAGGRYELAYGQGGSNNEVWFTAIPEPTSLALLALAGLTLLRRRR